MAATATAPARRTTGRAVPAGRPVAVPRRQPVPAKPSRRTGTSAPGGVTVVITALTAVADSRPVLGLTRTRLWIVVLGVLLVGIVGLNVMALSLNATSSKTAALSDELREANSALRAGIADQLSSERLQSAAARIGLVMPQAASALMLTPGPGDAEAAASRLRRGDITVGSTSAPPVPDAVATPAVTQPVDTAPAAPVEAVVAPVAPEPVAVVPDPAVIPPETQTVGVTP